MTYDSAFDFNNADKPSGDFDLIPVGTLCKLAFKIRPGSSGPGGWLKQSQSSDTMMLDVEMVVVDGPFRNRRIWQNMVVSGGKVDENGQSKAGAITRSTLRGILESARGIRSDDESDDAKRKRLVNDYGDFNGLEFVGKIGVEKGTQGYADKNKLLTAIGPENKDYAAVMGGSPSAGVPTGTPAAHVAAAAKPAAAAGVPAWAR